MNLHRRTAGILLHPTSLPGPLGNGDFGDTAYRFVDFLARSGQAIWQVLPLGPPGYGDSPYQAFSAFAGSPWLVSLERLSRDGWLEAGSVAVDGPPWSDQADFPAAYAHRAPLLEWAAENFLSRAGAADRAALDDFRSRHAGWLADYALFVALKEAHGGRAWTDWEPPLVHREPRALAAWRSRLARQVELAEFVQFQHFRQWNDLKEYAHSRGVAILGDTPIFVAHDSADVWARQELFHLDDRGRPTVVAGVPPDYFSADGQLWGNPLYRWDRLAADRFGWWIDRLRHVSEVCDLVRLDHFRGFAQHWEIPAAAATAAAGRWVLGPGAALFRQVAAELGTGALVAEDLGVITPDVEALRDEFHLPGMRVLQFAFGDDPKARDYRPHNYVRHCVAYTGTHDNDTTAGWFASHAGQGTTRSTGQIERERDFTCRYLGTRGEEIHWDMIRAVQASVANTAIVPLQDVLGLGSRARMNLPGSTRNNWTWRLRPDDLAALHQQRLLELAVLYDRVPPGAA